MTDALSRSPDMRPGMNETETAGKTTVDALNTWNRLFNLWQAKPALEAVTEMARLLKEEGWVTKATVEIVARAIAKASLEYSYGPNIPRPDIEVLNHFESDRARWIALAEAAREKPR